MRIKYIATFTTQNNQIMRYLFVIICACSLVACGNKINSLAAAGEKVVKTVTVCTELATDVVNENKTNAQSSSSTDVECSDTKASLSWDTRMMLW